MTAIAPSEGGSGSCKLVEAGWKVRDLARATGRSAKHVAARLALLQLPAGVRSRADNGDIGVARPSCSGFATTRSCSPRSPGSSSTTSSTTSAGRCARPSTKPSGRPGSRGVPRGGWSSVRATVGRRAASPPATPKGRQRAQGGQATRVVSDHEAASARSRRRSGSRPGFGPNSCGSCSAAAFPRRASSASSWAPSSAPAKELPAKAACTCWASRRRRRWGTTTAPAPLTSCCATPRGADAHLQRAALALAFAPGRGAYGRVVGRHRLGPTRAFWPTCASRGRRLPAPRVRGRPPHQGGRGLEERAAERQRWRERRPQHDHAQEASENPTEPSMKTTRPPAGWAD